MEDGYLLRPITYGFYSYKELLDGSLTLLDIGLCNDWINCKIHNENQ